MTGAIRDKDAITRREFFSLSIDRVDSVPPTAMEKQNSGYTATRLTVADRRGSVPYKGGYRELN